MELFQCADCSVVVTRKSSMIRHWKNKHFDRNISPVPLGQFLCEHCPKRFTTYKRKRYHIQRDHNVFPKERSLNLEKCDTLQCADCSVVVTTKSSMIRHWKNKHWGKNISSAPFGQFLCKQCSKRFTTYEKRRYHIKRDHNIFPKKSDANLNDLVLICTFCNKTFNHPDTLVNHMRKVHTIKEKKVNKCKYCSQTFSSYKEFSHHINSEHQESCTTKLFYDCAYCNKLFGSRSGRCKHEKVCLVKSQSYSNNTEQNVPAAVDPFITNGLEDISSTIINNTIQDDSLLNQAAAKSSTPTLRTSVAPTTPTSLKLAGREDHEITPSMKQYMRNPPDLLNLTSPDFISPKKRRFNIERIKEFVKCKRKLTHNLQTKVSKLESKVAKMKNSILLLSGENTLSSDQVESLIVSVF